ncbi:MAG TPA: Stp1/IreP family PP2C-type Ser/Thr phosphatase [Candidatus Onthomonas avicola]|nr:Stp1/IreP family PP2C-type Ser/Thr phosphatase [Candidatus Onthomonas avicola]
MQIRAWNITDVGCVRRQNEDACYTQTGPELALGIVCDGMGGANAGEVASQLAIEAFSRVVQTGGAPPEELMRRGLEQANREVYCYGWEHPDCRGMGTTLAAAMVLEDMAYLLNVGDSRVYVLCGQNIRQITRDHSLVEELVQAGQITREEARTHPRKNIITRALGTERHVTGDLYLHHIIPGELLLLCSDGLCNELTDEEMLDLIRKGPLEGGCQRLLEAALLRGAHDNVTAVLMQLGVASA